MSGGGGVGSPEGQAAGGIWEGGGIGSQERQAAGGI